MRGDQSSKSAEKEQPSSPHTFTLSRLSLSPEAPSITIHFATPSQPPNMPTFHCDNKHYTPAFVLPLDITKYQQNDSYYASLHLDKKHDQNKQKTQLYVPRPSRVNSYCCICNVMFQDYLTHLAIPKHQERIRDSAYSRQIEQLCSQFEKPVVEAGKVIKRGRKIKKGRGRAKISILNTSASDMNLSSLLKERSV